MSSNNVMFSVRRYFEQRHLNASTEWVDACVNWVKSQNPSASTSKIIQDSFQQWLLTDIRGDGVQNQETARNQLSIVKSDQLKVSLPAGHYTVQVNSAHDIGSSAYSQLQKINKVRDENSRVSADETESSRQYTAAWQPKANRMLKFTLTNGFETVSAVEHQSLTSIISIPVQPGLKLTLSGPIVVRRGILFLEPSNVKVLGGHVEEMDEEFSSRACLKDSLENRGRNRSTLPAQTFVPKGIPIKFKDGRAPLSKPSKRPLGNKSNLVSHPKKEESEVFDDDEDDLFASMDMPETQQQRDNDENVFDDGEDDLFTQIQYNTPKASSSALKRRRN